MKEFALFLKEFALWHLCWVYVLNNYRILYFLLFRNYVYLLYEI